MKDTNQIGYRLAKSQTEQMSCWKYELSSKLETWQMENGKPARPPLGHKEGPDPDVLRAGRACSGAPRWPVGTAAPAGAYMCRRRGARVRKEWIHFQGFNPFRKVLDCKFFRRKWFGIGSFIGAIRTPSLFVWISWPPRFGVLWLLDYNSVGCPKPESGNQAGMPWVRFQICGGFDWEKQNTWRETPPNLTPPPETPNVTSEVLKERI